MTITRTEIDGLRDEGSWYEIGYATGDSLWPLARLRVEPMEGDADRRWEPSAPVAPSRVTVRLSASLVETSGQVVRLGGRLMLGPEGVHSWQFDSAVPFSANAWLDQCAGLMIHPLIGWAAGLLEALDNRLFPVVAESAISQAYADGLPDA